MTKCGCETGGDCTKTTVCQCELTADKLAEALEALVGAPSATSWWGAESVLADARKALKEYKG